MDSVLNRVSEGIERGSAALEGIINDIQHTGHVSDPNIGRQISQRLDSLLGSRGGSVSLLLSPSHPAWRQLSVFSTWTALKLTLNRNNNKAVSNADLQVEVPAQLTSHDLSLAHRTCPWPCWGCVTSPLSLTRGRR